MSTPQEHTPSPVPGTAPQGGEVYGRWPWVEPTAWTERMLTALEAGANGGMWFRLIDKVWSLRNLLASYAKVAANGGAAGVDHVSVQQYGEHLDENVRRLHEQLRTGTYRPQAVRRVYLPKPGSTEQRPLGIPSVQDRVVQGAVRHVLEPIFERGFASHSYGFRPRRGCKDALRRVAALLTAGYRYVVDVDLKSYFDTIPHDRLLACLRQKVADGRVLALVAAFLKAGILDDLRHWEPDAGVPQGAVLSPLLSNIYLDPLDHAMAGMGFAMVRYADDIVVLCRSAAEAQRALAALQDWVAQAGLSLHPTKTRIVDAAAVGFDFLGYHFQYGKRWPRKQSLAKLKDTVRAQTHRTDGRSLPCIIADLNPTLRGWFGYFQHSTPTTFRRLDQWVRMRLRSILRKRQGGRGRGTGWSHQRWPTAFFAAQGLYNLVTAHAVVRQSC